jgi:hypothetical protein
MHQEAASPILNFYTYLQGLKRLKKKVSIRVHHEEFTSLTAIGRN